jgi:putative phosphonate metabolism protein
MALRSRETTLMRYAIYFTPPAEDPLTAMAEQWLGRSAFDGKELTLPSVEGLLHSSVAALTAEPRRYGFHATMKAPFRLAEGMNEADLATALADFCSARSPVVQKMKVARLGTFFAIVADGPSPELDQLANEIVEVFEPFRARLTREEFERRNPEKLTPSQLRNLERWGYPHVFEDFRFHMTLTGSVPENEADMMEGALEAIFNPLLHEPIKVGALALFAEAERGEPFFVKSLHSLGSTADKRNFA